MYGDGLFETVSIRSGWPCLWREHMERLELGAKRLGMLSPPRYLLQEECRRVMGTGDPGVIKIILTRGIGGRGYRPPRHPQPTRILIGYPKPDYPSSWQHEGVAVVFCRTPLGNNSLLAGIKHLNRLEQVLARNEWTDPEISEGIMCDDRGRVIAGTMSNLFLLTEGRLLTPRLDSCGIAGTVRRRVLAIAADEGLAPLETDIFRADLEVADGLFLTNSLIGVWPVCRLGTRIMDVGSLPPSLMRRIREEASTTEEWGGE